MKYPEMNRRDFLKLLPITAFSLIPFLPGKDIFSLRGLPIPPDNSDVLSEAQKRALMRSSLHFLAPDEESANRVALEIDFIEGLNEHSSNMCGPLSISIMRNAGLLGSWVEPRDFWLLNPREDLRTASNVFPSLLYDWFHFEEAVSEFDFSTFPLLAGDLIYLHAKPGDTYEHILVVNRVDAFGRAYTISNFFTESGTIIEERLLYDPSRPQRGQFERWANRSLRKLNGNTGGAGFRLWRVMDGRSLELSSNAASQSLRQSLDALFLSGVGKWYSEIREFDGPLIYNFNPYESFHPASTIKVPIAMAFMHWLEEQNMDAPLTYLATKGTGGRTYQQLLRAMLVESEEEATDILVAFLGEAQIQAQWRAWAFTRTQLSPRRSSSTELLLFFEELLAGEMLSEQNSSTILDLLAAHSPSDETRIGLIKDSLPENSVIYNKRGSLVQAPRVLSDSGIIIIPASSKMPGRKLLFTVHGLGKDGSSYEALEEMLDESMLLIGEYLTSA